MFLKLFMKIFTQSLHVFAQLLEVVPVHGHFFSLSLKPFSLILCPLFLLFAKILHLRFKVFAKLSV
jgi:hypothetical protein